MNKMGWHEQRIGAWSDFTDLVGRLGLNEQGGVDWYLRGQSDISWQLMPSLTRHLGNVGMERALGIEFGILRRFQSHYHLHQPPDGVDRSQWDSIAWWTIMQHHSCPTRLLDWTLSPFIALYFAVEGSENADGVVWLFPASALQEVSQSQVGSLVSQNPQLLETETEKAVFPLEPYAYTFRSAAQQATFTVCSYVLGDHGEIMADAFRGQEEKFPLNKIVVPAELKNECLSQLRILNITPHSLFPGLDGLGRSARDYAKLRVWRSQE